MDESENQDLYTTASHGNDLDSIFMEKIEDIDDIVFKDKRDYLYDLKMYFRYIRKNCNALIREKIQKNFTNIIYLTLDCPPFTPNSSRNDGPLEYILQMQKQYPDKDIRVLIPIINVDSEFTPSQKLVIEYGEKTKVLEKTSISFDFFIQNKIQTAVVYKFPKNNTNIQVYGIYSPIFSGLKSVVELSRLYYLAPFVKAARIAIKKMGKENFYPDIVHCENIPYYLGGEFETNLYSRIKVLQIIKDFTQIDIAKSEAFWAAINLADKKALKKITSDSLIKKYLARLFNLHNSKRFYQMKECLNFIYMNYYKFRKYVDKGEEIDENIIFNRLNARIMQIFPNISYGEELYFNPMIYSLKKSDFWATISKTYYDEVFEKPILSGKMFKYIEKTSKKSEYISLGCDKNDYPRENTRKIYHEFSLDNFRENRSKNKQALIKEFSIDRIKTNFVDPTLFKNENVNIVGSLDSFYQAPLLFANLSAEIFASGVDILFNTILKLFELHKNIQVIICIKDGLKINFIKNWIKFLEDNKYFNGRWVFVDADINLPKFLASSDMILLPRRANFSDNIHLIAMNYGCVPVASRNGLLNDNISDIFDDISEGCGFKTKQSLLADEDSNALFLAPLLKALNLYQSNSNSWNLLIKNCLKYDSSWSFEILEKYNQIYEELI